MFACPQLPITHDHDQGWPFTDAHFSQIYNLTGTLFLLNLLASPLTIERDIAWDNIASAAPE